LSKLFWQDQDQDQVFYFQDQDQDSGSQDQDQEGDFIFLSSMRLETKTFVSRATSLELHFRHISQSQMSHKW